jgi:rare lipoprotein A
MHLDARIPALVSLAAILLSGCGGNVRDGAPSGGITGADLPGDAVPRPEPRSPYGNGPIYEVLGKRYTVMESNAGYQERGVASWYGKKFHGRQTASRERYNMYAMTAAHRTLPLPTFVRVRNLRNNKSVVVRVNDRGPFVHNRIIDLSYAAAIKLDMIRTGTSLVEITAITFDGTSGDRPTSQPSMAPPAESSPAEPSPTLLQPNVIFVQVGAFGERGNAERRHVLLLSGGIDSVFIDADENSSPRLYRVRIGPIASVLQYDVLVEQLEILGIRDPYLVTR